VFVNFHPLPSHPLSPLALFRAEKCGKSSKLSIGCSCELLETAAPITPSVAPHNQKSVGRGIFNLVGLKACYPILNKRRKEVLIHNIRLTWKRRNINNF
jgi:hypothetical protein